MGKMLLLIPLLFILSILIYYFYPEDSIPPGIVIDHLVIYKAKRKMEAYSNDILIKTYTISLGKNPLGHKSREGDNKTPEGKYYIMDKNPNSRFHKNLGISYPSEKDILEAQTKNHSPGGDIKIHGLPNGQGLIGKFHRFKNWTAGCIAVTDTEIDELYNHVKIGSPVVISP